MEIDAELGFEIVSEFQPRGDQPDSIEAIVERLNQGEASQVLLGITGSGKTFTVANVIAAMNRPTLVIAHNKTLAAQLYGEFKELFPRNAVEYFVSYYDYYQPEAYVPSTDTYIEKDASINEMIDKLRHSATRSVLARPDVIVVASVSCIFGLGAPEDYLEMRLELKPGDDMVRDVMLNRLVTMLVTSRETRHCVIAANGQCARRRATSRQELRHETVTNHHVTLTIRVTIPIARARSGRDQALG